mmetsp:Transcript_15324/g.34364  ORF Transcript_15324/g.34364 Transcript_15324/m.34364 type:complete len:222 (-) Transcript_15324:1755-2420(-)
MHRQQSLMGPGHPVTHRPHRCTGPQPPLHHLMEPRKRGGTGPGRAEGRRRTAGRGPHPSRPVRERGGVQLRDRGRARDGHSVSHVSQRAGGHSGGHGKNRAAPTADIVRVQPRHGKFQRERGPILGSLLGRGQAQDAGRVRVGHGGSGIAKDGPGHWKKILGVRRRFWRPDTRWEFLHQWIVPSRSYAQTSCGRAQEASTANPPLRSKWLGNSPYPSKYQQ